MSNHKLSLSDEKLKFVLSIGLIPDHTKSMTEQLYDFVKILEVFKERYKTKV